MNSSWLPLGYELLIANWPPLGCNLTQTHRHGITLAKTKFYRKLQTHPIGQEAKLGHCEWGTWSLLHGCDIDAHREVHSRRWVVCTSKMSWGHDLKTDAGISWTAGPGTTPWCGQSSDCAGPSGNCPQPAALWIQKAEGWSEGRHPADSETTTTTQVWSSWPYSGLQVQSLAQHSGLRIWCCCSCGSSQDCSLDQLRSDPWPGSAIYCRMAKNGEKMLKTIHIFLDQNLQRFGMESRKLLLWSHTC